MMFYILTLMAKIPRKIYMLKIRIFQTQLHLKMKMKSTNSIRIWILISSLTNPILCLFPIISSVPLYLSYIRLMPLWTFLNPKLNRPKSVPSISIWLFFFTVLFSNVDSKLPAESQTRQKYAQNRNKFVFKKQLTCDDLLNLYCCFDLDWSINFFNESDFSWHPFIKTIQSFSASCDDISNIQDKHLIKQNLEYT